MTLEPTSLQDTLRDLINGRRFSQMPFDEALEFFCQTVSQALDVARVGIWEWSGALGELKIQAQWNRAGVTPLDEDTTLYSEQAKTYLQAIQSDFVLPINDAMSDPRCAELVPSYLAPSGVSSLLDCPLHNFGTWIGILCVEHIGPARRWSNEEREFAVSVASLVSLTFENRERVKAEKDARMQQKRYEFFTELAADWYWETDATLHMTRFSGARGAVTVEVDELIGRKLFDVPDLVPVMQDWSSIKRCLADRLPLEDLVFAGYDPQGNRRYGELSAKPVYDDDGAFIGYWGIARNVTKRIESEMALKANEKRYRNAARLAHLGAWVWDEIEGRISYCSPELAAIYGLPAEELIARTQAKKIGEGTAANGWRPVYEKDLSWVHPDDREHYKRVVDAASRNETGYEISVRIMRDDGSVRVLRELCEPVFDSEARFIATSGVLSDITEQEQRKNELTQSRQQLSNLMDNIPGAIYRVKNDKDWTPIYTSAGFDTFFGSTLGEDGSGDSDVDYSRALSDADMQRMEKAVAQAVATDSSYEFEYQVKPAEGGDPIWLFERGRPVRGDNGEIELEGILIDVSAKHAAEEALVHSQRLEAVGQLTGGVAHDFNNLLAVILGNLELLKDEISDPRFGDFINAAIGATLRGADLTQSMLSFARRARLEPSVFDLNKTISETRNWIDRILPENITIHTATGDALWPLEVDHGAAESLLLNLILNARDAMPNGGTLTIETSNVEVERDIVEENHEVLKQGRYVLLAVSDTGHGIPKETLGRIFEPFFTTKPAGAGSGLGLSMIQGFIKQSGGSVHVYSEVDVGTTFKIYFQVSDQGLSERPAAALASTDVEFGGVRVLVAEDEPDVARIMALTLQRFGCEVILAQNGDAALEMFKADPEIDLLLTDIVMPGDLMGTHLAKAVRALRDDLPVIFMSGYANEAQVHGNGLRPEDIRLSKPVGRAALLDAMQLALGGGGQGGGAGGV